LATGWDDLSNLPEEPQIEMPVGVTETLVLAEGDKADKSVDNLAGAAKDFLASWPYGYDVLSNFSEEPLIELPISVPETFVLVEGDLGD
jgi:hypothetical protein